MKYHKKLDAKDFLCIVRSECMKGCGFCKFREPDVSISDLEKYCALRNFRFMSDKSLVYLMQKAQTFYR